MATMFTHTGGGGVVTVEASLKEVFRNALQAAPNAGASAKDIEEIIGSDKVFATSHFKRLDCKGHTGSVGVAGETPIPPKDGAQPHEELPNSEDTAVRKVNPGKECWKYDDTQHGLDGSTHYTMLLELSASADIKYGFTKIKAGLKYIQYVDLNIQTYLGNASPSFDSKSGTWTVPGGDDDVTISPGCHCTQGETVAEDCGADEVSGTLWILINYKRIISVSTNATLDAPVIAEAEVAAQMKNAVWNDRTYHVNFLHTPERSMEVAA